MAEKEKITKDMLMSELLQEYPETIPVMLKFGLHCIGCPMRSMESIEQGALGHGLSEKELKALVKELNDSVSE